MEIAKNDIEQAVGLLKILISTPSVSRDESEAADKLQSYMERSIPFPGTVHRHLNNIWCIAPGYDESRPTLLLDAHIDTVKPVAAWTKSPFTPVVEDDCLYGLGSNDDGGSLVAMLHAFYKLAQTEQAYNLIFLASAEEEVSGKDGIESVLPMLPPISCAIIGEPTGMNPAIAEKGLMVLDCTAKGKSGHAARNEGINAIYEALPDIEWFRTYTFPKVSTLLGPVKMSVTQINAGTQHNVVPDTCKYVVDVRSNECYSNKEIADIISANVKSEATPRSLRLNSSSIAPEHPLVRRMVELGRTPFGSPTLSNQALISGVPCLKLGPGESSRSHTANEFIKISEIRKGIELYIKLLDGIEL